jgi:hypothetical protein
LRSGIEVEIENDTGIIASGESTRLSLREQLAFEQF